MDLRNLFCFFIEIALEIYVIEDKIMMLRWMKGFIPCGIGFYIDLLCLSVKRHNAQVALSAQFATFHTTLEICQHLIHLVSVISFGNQRPDTTFQYMTAKKLLSHCDVSI